jgi:hypothetical protein
MPFVSVPKDLSKVKTKVALNLTKRQLICFGAAAVVGIPAYIFTRGVIGNEGAALLMIALMLPFFLAAMYEKDGQPAEKIARNFIQARFVRPPTRPYRTENLYHYVQREVNNIGKQDKTAGKAAVRRTVAGKKGQGGASCNAHGAQRAKRKDQKA